ncbi:MAG: hypothetical protein DMG05_20860 [Acidobacteria bacterium]|nr:MAG: hypothetical protein DMG05_20860 [Acidobacteriota bacterium]
MGASREMIDAVKSGDVAKVKALLETDAALVNAQAESGESAILLATYYGRKEVAEVLLATGAELDIFEASAVGHAGRITVLLRDHLARVNSYASDGWTPLHLAAFFGHAEAAKILVAQGANVEALSRNSTANTPLHAAVAGRKTDLVKLLLDSGANVNAQTGNGWRPLHLAAHGGHKELTETLLGKSAEVNAKNGEGQTPLTIAIEKSYEGVADLLRQHAGTT